MKKIPVMKPELQPGENRTKWMQRCVPYLIREGRDSDEATATCSSMFDQAKGTSKVKKINLIGLLKKLKIEKGGKDVSRMNFESIGVCKLAFSEFAAEEAFDLGDIHIEKGEELHYVLGVVLEPETVDATVTDKSVGDIYSEEEVRKTAHQFMIDYRGQGQDLMHDRKARPDILPVESFLAPVAFDLNGQAVKKGAWLMGSLVFDSEGWQGIKSGEYTGFSIDGVTNARYEPA